MARELEGKVALITGATRGIGRGVALAYAEAGADVVLVGRSSAEQPHRFLPGTLEETAAEAQKRGAAALCVQANLGSEEDCARVVEETLGRFGRCDILFNNAAVTFIGPFLEVPASRWRAVLNVNLQAAVVLSQALLPGMIESGGGHIINLSSGAAIRGNHPIQLPYAVSKAALERLTLGLHSQFRDQNVAVYCVRIDSVIPTEGAVWGAPDVVETARYSTEDFARSMVWVATQPASSAGQVLTLGELERKGVLQPSLRR